MGYYMHFTFSDPDDMEMIYRVRDDADYSGPTCIVYDDLRFGFLDVTYADAPMLLKWIVDFELSVTECVLGHADPYPGCGCTPCMEGGVLDMVANYPELMTAS